MTVFFPNTTICRSMPMPTLSPLDGRGCHHFRRRQNLSKAKICAMIAKLLSAFVSKGSSWLQYHMKVLLVGRKCNGIGKLCELGDCSRKASTQICIEFDVPITRSHTHTHTHTHTDVPESNYTCLRKRIQGNVQMLHIASLKIIIVLDNQLIRL